MATHKELYLDLLSISIIVCAAIGWQGLSRYLNSDIKFGWTSNLLSPVQGVYLGAFVEIGPKQRVVFFATHEPQAGDIAFLLTTTSGPTSYHYNLLWEDGVLKYDTSP